VAGDAALGVGGAEEGGNELAVRAAIPVALELPCREAADVDMKYIQSGAPAVVAELNLHLQLILCNGHIAHCADHTNSRPAPSTIGSLGRHLSSADRFSGSRAQNSLVGHSQFPGVRR